MIIYINVDFWYFISCLILLKMIFTSSLLLDLLGFVTILLLILHIYISRKHEYWSKLNVPILKPSPIFGNFYEIITFKLSIGEYLAKVYKSSKEPYLGIYMFGEPLLVVRDPKIVKNVLVRDFSSFTDRNVAKVEHDKLASSMLFLEKNPEWKWIRSKLTPAFSTGKLKSMYSMMHDISEDMVKYVLKHEGEDGLDAKEIASKFATDVVARCAFGINAQSFEHENAAFRTVGRLTFDHRAITAFQQAIYFFVPKLAVLFKLRFVRKKILDYLSDIFWKTIKQRESSGIKCNDLIDYLIDFKNSESFKNINFDEEKLLAQPMMFFFAGFETTSAVISYALYELSVNPDIQEKLREEILLTTQKFNGLTYESIQDMPFLNMIFYETLRKYPSLPFLDRRCNEACKISDTDLVIEKGVPVYIPVMGLHYDEKFFPEPEKFIPERFKDMSQYNKEGLYFLPFGDGPRNCIGGRFGTMSVKLAICQIVSRFYVKTSSKSVHPPVIEKKSFLLAARNGLPMKFIQI